MMFPRASAKPRLKGMHELEYFFFAESTLITHISNLGARQVSSSTVTGCSTLPSSIIITSTPSYPCIEKDLIVFSN